MDEFFKEDKPTHAVMSESLEYDRQLIEAQPATAE